MFHLDMAKAEETVGYTAPDLYHLGEFHEGTCRRTTGGLALGSSSLLAFL